MPDQLTPKQEKFAQKYIEMGNASEAYRIPCTQTVRRVIYRKLDALDRLMRLVAPAPTPEELERRWEHHAHLVAPLLSRMVSRQTPDFARCAAMRLLEYIVPEWKSHLDERLLGFTVDRGSPEVRAWRRAVLARDGRRCTKCGGKHKLHAHHLLPWATRPESRVVVENGVTLCEPCHLRAHGGAWGNRLAMA